MKCPNCEADLPEDSWYCEKCGCDIHIVPDYDLELESNILESIEYIAADANGEKSWHNQIDEESSNAYDKSDKSKVGTRHNKKYFVKMAFNVCCLGFILSFLVAGICLWHYYSYNYQIRRAVSCMSKEQYTEAITYYLRALELEKTDVEVVFSLAEAYKQKGNKIEYEYLLRQIIRNPSCSQEQLERAYGKLIAIYKAREEYDSINEILLLSENTAIRTAYQSYLAASPRFSYEEGDYDKAVPLKLSSDTIGRIYYTTDGSEPDNSSSLYTAPILIDSPDTVIKAVAVNEYGIYSEVVTKAYNVKIDMEEAPQISVISGTYYVPMMIEVLEADSRDVYYTTDGTQPNLHSTLYTGPIPMPLGRSVYNFAYVDEDGNRGKVAERRYYLKLETAVPVEEAEALVVECMLMQQKIYNAEGNYSAESSARYLYECQYVISIKEQGDFYVIAESFMDEKGVKNKTGSYYAVSVNEKRCFKLTMDENNNYSIVEILIDSPQEG